VEEKRKIEKKRRNRARKAEQKKTSCKDECFSQRRFVDILTNP